MSWIGNSANAWMVSVTFLVTIVFGMFFGYLRGWKKSLFFCLWNLLMLIIVVFMTPVIFNAAFSSADTSTTSGVVISNAGPYFLPMIMIPILIFLDLLAFFPYYYYVRKLDFMQESLKEPKFNLGTMTSSMLGMGIGFISALPMAALATNVAAVASGHVTFTSFNDAVFTMVTFGQFDGIANEMTSIRSTLHVLESKEVENEKTSGVVGLHRLITGNLTIESDKYNEAVKSISENRRHYANIFSSSLANSLLTDLPEFQTVFIEGGQEAWANFESFVLPDKIEPFKFNKATENNLYGTIIVLAEFGNKTWNTNSETGRVDQVDQFIAKLQGK